jgi:hypothetical protein
MFLCTSSLFYVLCPNVDGTPHQRLMLFAPFIVTKQEKAISCLFISPIPIKPSHSSFHSLI